MKTIAANTELGAEAANDPARPRIRVPVTSGWRPVQPVEGVGFDNNRAPLVSDAVAAYRAMRRGEGGRAHGPAGGCAFLKGYIEANATASGLRQNQRPRPPRAGEGRARGTSSTATARFLSRPALRGHARLRETVRRAGITELSLRAEYLRVSPVGTRLR